MKNKKNKDTDGTFICTFSYILNNHSTLKMSKDLIIKHFN